MGINDLFKIPRLTALDIARIKTQKGTVEVKQRGTLRRAYDPKNMGAGIMGKTKKEYAELRQRGVEIPDAFIIGYVEAEQSPRAIRSEVSREVIKVGGVFYLPASLEGRVDEKGRAPVTKLSFLREERFVGYEPSNTGSETEAERERA